MSTKDRPQGPTAGKSRGLFVTLEGIEGAGKSSSQAFVCELLRQMGVSVVHTREPGGTPLAEALRDVLLDDWHEGVPAITELLIVFAARAAHLHNKVWPQLAAGHWVVSDRFTDATYAYQGAGRGLPVRDVATLETLVQKDFRPDHVLLFDVPVEVGLARARKRPGMSNRFDREQLAFMERVRAGYLARAAADPQRYAVIDAVAAPEGVLAQIEGVIRRLARDWPA